jgi:hypothetical protein
MDNFNQGILNFKDNVKDSFNLKPYGIFEEESDIRSHVSDKVIYVFKTKELIKTLKENEFRQAHAYQPGYEKPTASGYLVPPKMINDIRELKFRSWNEWVLFDNKWNTTEKGKWAVRCTIQLLKIGRFPFWIEAKQNDDIKIDIKGTDILVVMNNKIQVKCDYPAVKTGNLYIQTSEINPFKMY